MHFVGTDSIIGTGADALVSLLAYMPLAKPLEGLVARKPNGFAASLVRRFYRATASRRALLGRLVPNIAPVQRLPITRHPASD